MTFNLHNKMAAHGAATNISTVLGILVDTGYLRPSIMRLLSKGLRESHDLRHVRRVQLDVGIALAHAQSLTEKTAQMTALTRLLGRAGTGQALESCEVVNCTGEAQL